MKKINVGLLALGLFISSAASADMVMKDWKETGDGLIAFDTSTGIEWLALTQTSGYSINGATSETGAGGLFEGWAVSNKSQMGGLMDSLYPTLPWGGSAENRSYVNTNSGISRYEVNEFTSPFLDAMGGWTRTQSGMGAWRADYSFDAIGIFADGDSVGYGGVMNAYSYNPNGSTYTTQASGGSPTSWTRDTAIAGFAIFLMNDTSAPESSSLSNSAPASAVDVSAPVGGLSLFAAFMALGWRRNRQRG